MNEILLYSILVIIVLIVLLILFFILTRGNVKLSKSAGMKISNSDFYKHGTSVTKDLSKEQYSPLIPVNRLPSNFEVEESLLHEITNPNIISRISSLTPAIGNAMGKVETITTTATSTSTLKGDYYRVILKSGDDLLKVSGEQKLFRGYTKGFKEHAMLEKFNPKTLKDTKQTTALATSATANIMNAASLVVGQYYMSQVNAQLENMDKAINDISNFQKTEYKSRIRSLIANVGDISNYIEEIFEDDTIRNNKLIHLQNLQEKATQLLEQVNLTIEGYLLKKVDIDFKTYIESINDLESLVSFQEILLETLNEIARLNFILGKGKLTEENSLSLSRIYNDISERVHNNLIDWHKTQMEKHKIYLEDKKFRKRGIEGVLTSLTGFIKDDWRFSSLDVALANKVNNQISIKEFKRNIQDTNLYEEDIKLLIKDGKTYFWLPEKSVN